MKKLLISFILIAAPLLAQSITVDGKTELYGNGDAYFPKFSPDGSKVFFTHSGYKGLEYVDIASGSVEKLSDANGAGYEFCFSSDGSEVYYKMDSYKGMKKYSTLLSQNLASKEVKTLEAEKRNLSFARTVSEGTLYYQYEMNLKSVEMPSSLRKSSAASDIALLNESGAMVLVRNGYKKTIEPFGKNIYIWPSLSPDGTKILFTLASKGTFISDLDGNILASLGKANAPQWSPDGKWIVYMDDYDNGSNFTKSDLFAVSADGSVKVDLSYGEDEIEMYPQWSADGSKIVYHTDSGKIMLLNLTIAE